ncbi:hypothetical protein K438DRAFT_1953695 [Mycena galopus ATCC 62051]|nr:hypothetical protein K438DRAFT_1953695 [Mycena galopus ATCC 62051]
MSSPPAKRQRTKDAHLTRSDTWRSDGNVVLQAGNTQFRVHWSVLALHSSVFRDMQGLPQPPDQLNVEGCPIVEIFDDPDDVEYLLKVLYNPTFLSQKVLSLPVIGALIRLGRKYDFKDLFDSAVACLMSANPTTLEEYDLLPTDDTLNGIEFYPAVYFDMVTLASENNILAALPRAYYAVLKNFDLRTLFDGISREDGTRAHLSSLDLRRCVIASETLSKRLFQSGYTFGWARKWEYDDCTDLAECRWGRESIVIVYSDMEGVSLGALDKPYDERHFCDTCVGHLSEYMAAGRKKFWDELPAIFDLPPWSELKNDI